MNKLQIFLTGLLILILAIITAIFSLYALNPGFAAYVDARIKEQTAAGMVVADMTAADGGMEEADGTAAADWTTAVNETDVIDDTAAPDESEGIDETLPIEYVAPSDIEIRIPETLSDKTGYVDITVQEKTVSDEEADRIEQELSTGPLGDDLQFDPEFYPYYAMLDDRGKALYRQIFANINEMNPAFRSVDRLMTGKRIDSAFEAVFNDHPELFFVDTEYRTVYRKNGDFIELDLFYNDTAGNIEKSRSEFNSAADSIISEAAGSDYEKERYVHNRLSELFDYQRNSLDQSAYSGLVLNKTVCAGYARSFSYIMTRLGIPCYLCTGYAGEPHGWNIIKLDGDYYNVDVTWDDTGTEKPYYYEWFNKTDNDYGTTHLRKSLSVYLPPCNGTKYRGLEPEDTEEEAQADKENPLTLDTYGFSEADVIQDMNIYYDELTGGMIRLGKGRHTLSMVIDESVLEECNRAYDNGDVKDRVLRKVLDETGATTANVSCNATELQGGYYLIQHEITVY